MLRTGNKKAALFTLLGDVGKGVLAVLLARWLAPSLGLSDMIIMLVGLAAFIGHLYPVFHGFKGGKGVATAGGVLLALNPLHGLAVLATWLAVAFLTRYSSLAAITAAFMAPIYWQLFYGIDARALVILFIAALLVWRHRENINRLLKGKESKIGATRPPSSPGQIPAAAGGRALTAGSSSSGQRGRTSKRRGCVSMPARGLLQARQPSWPPAGRRRRRRSSRRCRCTAPAAEVNPQRRLLCGPAGAGLDQLGAQSPVGTHATRNHQP